MPALTDSFSPSTLSPSPLPAPDALRQQPLIACTRWRSFAR